MAKSTNYAAYQQSRPLQGDIGKTMQYWNEDAARRRQEEQQKEQFAWRKEQTELQRQEREAKQRTKDITENMTLADVAPTGVRSLDTVAMEMMGLAREQYKPIILEIDEAKRKKDFNAEIAARAKLNELNQFGDRLKNQLDIISTYRNEAKEAVEKGEIYQEEFDEWDKKIQGNYKNMRGGIDSGFKPVLAFVDQDGDGVNDIQDVASFDNIMNYTSLPRFLKKASMENIAKGLADMYETETKTTDNGYRSRKTVKPKQEALSTAIKNRLYDSEGGYTDLMKSLAFSKGHGYNVTPEVAKSIEDEMLQTSMGMYATQDIENVTASRGGGTSKTEQPKNITGFNITETDFGDFAKTSDNSKYWGVNVPSKKLSPTSKPVKLILDAPENGENSNFMIDKFTVSNQNGKDVIVASGNYVSDEGATQEETKEVTDEYGTYAVGTGKKTNNPEKRQRAEIILSEAEVSQLSDWIGKNPYDAATRPKEKEEESTETQNTKPATAADIFKKNK